MNRVALAIGLSLIALALWTRRGQALISEGWEMAEKLTRGERNNNPGNIVQSNIAWQGKLPTPSDSRFEQFASAEQGIRALAKLLLTYQDKYGLRTVEQIINRWAPPNENDTSAYVNAVANSIGRARTEPLNLHDEMTLFDLTKAIIKHENGRVIYDDTTLALGVDLALA